MPKEEEKIVCGDCGHSLPSEWIPKYEPTRVSEKCGSRNRKVIVEITVFMPALRARLTESTYKLPSHHSKRKNRHESKDVDQYNRDLNEIVEVYREFDRVNDRYVEIIRRKGTGEVIRYVDQPLTEHQRHGCDRAKPACDSG
tara:strand:- start:274 stop:699 length:426 start_codon:yes stop_codon:yes gene_type:complete